MSKIGQNVSVVQVVMATVSAALQDWKQFKLESLETFRDDAALRKLAASWAGLQRFAVAGSSSEVLELEEILRQNADRLAEAVLEFNTSGWLEAGASLAAHQERLEADEEYLWGDEGNKEAKEKYEPLCLSKLAELDNALLSLFAARTFCGELPIFGAVEEELGKCVEFVAANQQAFYDGFVWAQETVACFGELSKELRHTSRMVLSVAAHGEGLMKQSREGPVGRWIQDLLKKQG